MKLRFNLRGVVVEYERRPLPERRFRALCLLAAAGMYGGMVAAVSALCGAAGVAAVAVVTMFIAMFASC